MALQFKYNEAREEDTISIPERWAIFDPKTQAVLRISLNPKLDMNVFTLFKNRDDFMYIECQKGMEDSTEDDFFKAFTAHFPYSFVDRLRQYLLKQNAPTLATN
jgi:hypothetical protein